LKKTLYGPARIAVGGQDEDSVIVKGKRDRLIDDVEQVFFHESCPELAAELVHMIGAPKSIGGVVDMTPGQGTLAMACIRLRIPYLAIAFTPLHADKLKAWLVKKVWREFIDVKSALHEPRLAALLSSDGGPSAEPDLNGGEDDGKKGKKAKMSKTKANGDGEDDKPGGGGGDALVSEASDSDSNED